MGNLIDINDDYIEHHSRNSSPYSIGKTIFVEKKQIDQDVLYIQNARKKDVFQYGITTGSLLENKIKELKKRRNSLRFRRNLVQGIVNENSEATTMCLKTYKRQLSEALSKINNLIDELEKSKFIIVEEEDNRQETKKLFIAQVMMSLLKILDINADIIESNLGIIKDMRAFVAWFYDDTLHAFSAKEMCENAVLINYLYNELELEKDKCNYCSQETVRGNSKCLCCGKMR